MAKTVSALVAVAGLLASVPAMAAEMRADVARRLVVENLFSFTCFEGTSGEGRVHADGSVRGDSICAVIRGIPFEPCFELERTDVKSFRGSLAGMSFAFCQFTKQPNRPGMASTAPLSIRPTAAGSSHH
jgi:hypothetical protein